MPLNHNHVHEEDTAALLDVVVLDVANTFPFQLSSDS